MSHRRPGRIFWIRTSAIAIISPRVGDRRIDSRVHELERKLEDEHVKNEALVSENRHLRKELYNVQAENNLFRVQDEMNTVVNQKTQRIRTTSWACPDMETTASMPRPSQATTCPN